MRVIKTALCTVLTVAVAGTVMGQLVTGSRCQERPPNNTDDSAPTVHVTDLRSRESVDRLHDQVESAIKQEFLLSGVLPSLRTRPIGIIVSFLIEEERRSSDRIAAELQELSILGGCREAIHSPG